MKFTSTAGAIRNAMNTARQATPSSPSLVAYTAVQLTVEGGDLRVTGSDGDTTIVATLPVQDTSDGTVLVLPRPLVSYLGTLSADHLVSVEVGGQLDEVAVRPQGSNEYRFRTVAATFPQPAMPSGSPNSVNFSRFYQALASVRTAVAKENPVVQLVSTDTGLVLHATDNYRLTRAELPEAGFGAFSGILPLQVLDRVAKMEASQVTVDGRSRVISFSSSDTILTTRLLSVPFPAVEGVLESVPPNVVDLPASATLQACTRLAAITESSPVRCLLTEGTLALNVSNADLGSGTEQVAVSEHGTSGSFEFLARLTYLQDAIVATGADTVRMHYSGSVQPLFIMASSPISVLTVVMPVRG